MIAAQKQCPGMEDLAAFADATLAPEERDVVEKHLAGCDRCLEVVSETLHFLEFQESGAKKGELVRGPFGRPKAAVIALLAASVLVVAVGLGVWQVGAAPYDLDAITARLEPGDRLREQLGEYWDSPGWETFRSGSGVVVTSSSRASFRAGAHAVSIAVGAELRDAGAVRSGIGGIDSLDVDDPQSPDSGILLIGLKALAARLDLAMDTGPDWGAVESGSDELMRYELAGDDEDFRVLGLWAQSARFASLLKDDSYFRSGRWRKGLRALEKIELSDAASASLQALQELPADQHDHRVELLTPIFRALG